MEKKKLVVLSGAGISAESGVPVYRGEEGIWNDLTLLELASLEGWKNKKATVIDFFNDRRAALADVRPNKAHLLLAKMEGDFDVTILTQNVDDLHERAGSSHVIHLHGELTCVRPEDTYTAADGFSEEYVINVGYNSVKLGDTGGRNHTQLRPHVVFFGEPVVKLPEAVREVESADILLVVGTSLKVYPVADLVHLTAPDCDVYVIDPDDISFNSSRPPCHIKEKATVGMEEFARILGFKESGI
jgi:NAD-dependent protein deacetylases, SIR2 family